MKSLIADLSGSGRYKCKEFNEESLKIIRSFVPFNTTRRMPVNALPEHDDFFKRLLTVKGEKVFIMRLSNVKVVAQRVIFKTLNIYKNLSLHNDDGLIIKYSFFQRLKILLFWERIKLDQNIAYTLIDNIYSHTYYHWLTEALPRLFLVKDYLSNAVLLLPSNHKEAFHRESLDIFEVRNIKYIEKKIRYDIPDLITATQIGRMANYYPAIVKDMAAYVKKKVDPVVNLGERIYISRANTATRKITNETEVEALVKEFGFVIVQFEDYSFSQQVSIASYCRYMIGIHGAGLTNMIFMTDESVVMELRKNDGGENYFYFSLASTFNHHYYYQFCSSDHRSVQESDIMVNVEELKENLRQMGL